MLLSAAQQTSLAAVFGGNLITPIMRTYDDGTDANDADANDDADDADDADGADDTVDADDAGCWLA